MNSFTWHAIMQMHILQMQKKPINFLRCWLGALLCPHRCHNQAYSGPFKWMRVWVSFSSDSMKYGATLEWTECALLQQFYLYLLWSITCPHSFTEPYHVKPLFLSWIFFIYIIHLSLPPGWEYPRCTPVIGRFNVGTPSLHDPCVRPEKWNKVNERLDVTWKNEFLFWIFYSAWFHSDLCCREWCVLWQ